jgi:hypothetical protein
MSPVTVTVSSKFSSSYMYEMKEHVWIPLPYKLHSTLSRHPYEEKGLYRNGLAAIGILQQLTTIHDGKVSET